MMSVFVCKTSAFFGKNNTFTHSTIFKTVFVVLQFSINENVSFADYVSEMRVPDYSKSTIKQNNDSDVIISINDVIFKFFDTFLFSLSILVTGPSSMSISSPVLQLWQLLTRNPEIGKPWLSFAQYMETWASRNRKFGTDVSNKMLLNAARCPCYIFYRFWVIKGKPAGGVKLTYPPPSPPRLRLNIGKLEGDF